MSWPVANFIHLESAADLQNNMAVISNLLNDGVKVHFVSKHHICTNEDKFNMLRGICPCIKIITIAPSLRQACAIVLNEFNNIAADDDNNDDDDNNYDEYNEDNISETIVGETEAGYPTCPQCGCV